MRTLADHERAEALVRSGHITRERACDRKKAFFSRNDARHAIKIIRKEHGREMQTYRCPFCGHLHLTTVSNTENE